MANCEPGEMAIVIAGFPRENLGRVIKVLRPDVLVSVIFRDVMREYEGDLVGPAPGLRAGLVSDSCLKPLRDPGDDAADTTETTKRDEVTA